MSGRPLWRGGSPATFGQLLLVGGFLSVWLALWTLGGIAVMRELLRLVWAEDRIIILPSCVRIARRFGPFNSCREFARDALLAVYVRPYQSALMAQTRSELHELSTLGTSDERVAAADLIRRAFNLPATEEPIQSEMLPHGWKEISSPEGWTLLVSDPGIRRLQAWVLTAAAAGGWVIALILIFDALRNPKLGIISAMALALGCWMGWKAIGFWRSRREWRIEPGRLTLLRRFGNRLTVLWEAARLELNERTDCDGETWYELAAVDAAGTPHRLMHKMHDVTECRMLGQWLARRTGIPLDDRVPTASERAKELVRSSGKLAASGSFGGC